MTSRGEALAARVAGRARLSRDYAAPDYDQLRQQAAAAEAAGHSAAARLQTLRSAARASQAAAVRRIQLHLWSAQQALLAQEAQHGAAVPAADAAALRAAVADARQLPRDAVGLARLRQLQALLGGEQARLAATAAAVEAQLPALDALDTAVFDSQRAQRVEALAAAVQACPDEDLAQQLRLEQQVCGWWWRGRCRCAPGNAKH